jgi:predicted nucleic acid-binding protein
VKAVFADTFYWISLINPDDAHHKQSIDFDRSKDRPVLITTEEVIGEFLTFFGSKGPFFRTKAVAVTRQILVNQKIRVLPQTHDTFVGGLELYAARPDKEYSLTDCISMATMRLEGLNDVLTNDAHFAQEGFHPIFRDS